MKETSTRRFIFKKELTPTEAKRHYILVDKEHRDIFPTSGETFKIIVGHGTVVEVTIDNTGRIFAGHLWDHITFQEGDTVIFARNPDGSFKVSKR